MVSVATCAKIASDASRILSRSHSSEENSEPGFISSSLRRIHSLILNSPENVTSATVSAKAGTDVKMMTVTIIEETGVRNGRL